MLLFGTDNADHLAYDNDKLVSLVRSVLLRSERKNARCPLRCVVVIWRHLLEVLRHSKQACKLFFRRNILS